MTGNRSDAPAPHAIANNGSAYGRPPQHSNKRLTEVGPGTPMGELMRRYWQPIARIDGSWRSAEKGENPRGGAGAVPRPARPRRPALSALHASRHDAVLRQGRGSRHPLLLSRLAVRRRRQLPGAALRAERRMVSRALPPALVSGRGALRLRLRLSGAARKEAGAAPLRQSRGYRAPIRFSVDDRWLRLHRRSAASMSCRTAGYR